MELIMLFASQEVYFKVIYIKYSYVFSYKSNLCNLQKNVSL